MGGRLALASAIAVSMLIAGCSSGAQGATGPSDVATPASSASSSPSSSPSASATATLDDVARARIPAAARAHTPQGAEAFARFYLEQVNQAWMAPDPELIRPYALESCKTCANYIATAAWLVTDRLHYDGVPATLGASALLATSGADVVTIQVAQAQKPARILRQDGTVDQQLSADASLLDVRLDWRGESWLVATIQGERA
jgi:hypothetical protein